MLRLTNVIDTRTGKHHSVAIVKERLARYFVPDVQPDAEEEEAVAETEETTEENTDK